ncbi:MAG: hypothetical protein AMXMBFR84_42430 [Candidatus Hydrogenedentota bacterium]
MRLDKSWPLLDTIGNWPDEQQRNVLPKSPIGIAIADALNHWAALARLLDDGIIAIDNNAAEQAVRGIAIGRKNWLFLGSDNGGRAAAIHYTLIQTAKRHGIDPYVYIRNVLLRLTTEPTLDLRQLFPDQWKTPIQG